MKPGQAITGCGCRLAVRRATADCMPWIVLKVRKKNPDGRRDEVEVQSAREARQDAAEGDQEAKQEKVAAQLEAERAILCRVFAKYPKGTTKTQVRDHCGISSRRFPTAFAAAIEAGDIVPCHVVVGNKKKPMVGYKLNHKEAA